MTETSPDVHVSAELHKQPPAYDDHCSYEAAQRKSRIVRKYSDLADAESLRMKAEFARMRVGTRGLVGGHPPKNVGNSPGAEASLERNRRNNKDHLVVRWNERIASAHHLSLVRNRSQVLAQRLNATFSTSGATDCLW